MSSYELLSAAWVNKLQFTIYNLPHPAAHPR